jgi:hypothetical protein
MVANREKGGMEYGMEGWEDRSLVFIDTFSYKHTTEGDDLLIMFVFPSFLPA